MSKTVVSVNASSQSHAQRMLLEHLGQLLATASTFLDRIILTALFLRQWHIATFEAWSTCIALTGMISIFELGFNLYFNNQLTIEMERGDHQAFRKTYAIGNGLFAICGVTSFAVLLGLILLGKPFGPTTEYSALLAAIVLSVANSAKISLCAINALYRANRDFARFATLQGVSETLRVCSVFSVVILGGGLIAAAVASALASIMISVIFVVIDTRRRYFPHRYLSALPRKSDLPGILGNSLLYMAHAVPIMLYTSLPVIALQRLELAPGVLAAFVLARTLSNAARSPLQAASVVFGQECGRRIMIYDLEGAKKVFHGAGRLFSVLSGVVSGLLIGGGNSLTTLWTGKFALFDSPLLLIAMAPMFLTPNSVLVNGVLVSHQAPLLPTVARWLQAIVAVGTYALASTLEPALRMMLALSAGEILGYAPLAYWACSKFVPGIGLYFHLKQLVLVLACTAIGATLTNAVLMRVAPLSSSQTIMCLSLIATLLAVVVFFVGLDRQHQKQLLGQIGTLVPIKMFVSRMSRR